MNKSLILTILTCATRAAATPTPAATSNSCTNFSGFFAGANLGKGASIFQSNGCSAEGPMKGRAGAQGTLAGVFAGYGRQFISNTYLAAELALNYDFTNTTVFHNKLVTDKVKSGLQTSLSSLLGYFSNPATLWYAKLGAQRGKIMRNRNYADGPNFVKKNPVALLLGLGMLNNFGNMFARVEYTCAISKTLSNYVSSRKNSKFNNTQHKFMLGVGYKF